MGYSPWGQTEVDMTERLTQSHTGEKDRVKSRVILMPEECF